MVDVANKGRGLVVEEPVTKGEYVVEYAGDVYHQKQRKARELEYTENEEGCFILEVQTKEGWICIDPTRRPLCPGRLMNHSPSSHATLVPFRPLKINGKWRVGFVAARDLAPGDELTWDYGCSPGGIDWLKRRTAKTSAVVRKPWNVMCYMCRVFRMHEFEQAKLLTKGSPPVYLLSVREHKTAVEGYAKLILSTTDYARIVQYKSTVRPVQDVQCSPLLFILCGAQPLSRLSTRIKRFGERHGRVLPSATRVRKIGATEVAMKMGDSADAHLVTRHMSHSAATETKYYQAIVGDI